VYQFHPLCCQPRMHYLHHLHQTRSTPSTCTKHRLQGTII
jgi:hypothetical protein